MLERLCSRHIVLLGIGHTNAHIVRKWGMQSLPDTDLTCLSDNSIATYSGMLPAALAGQIQPESMEIDLVRLCASVGARLITDKAVGLDLGRQQVLFEQRPPIPFDVLSIGIGSVPTIKHVSISGEALIKIKPMQTFLDRLRRRVKQVQLGGPRPLRIAIVGSGVAGIEIAFCLPALLRELGVEQHELRIVTRSSQILPEVGSAARQLVLSELDRRGVEVTVGRAVKSVCDGGLELDDAAKVESDMVIWATGASAPPLLGQLGLPLDDRGFLATDGTLRSISGLPIFAVGDSGTIVQEKLPKAGVFAVRQGPILWENIERLLRQQRLRTYRPQRTFLKLINTGNGRAIGEWHGWAFAGRWVMRLKSSIDEKFINKYQPRSMQAEAEPMQCRGCGSKLGAEVLQSALAPPDQQSFNSDFPAIAMEDAAEIGGDASSKLVASTDFFSSPTLDAFLSGRIAALHSASDILASGAQPLTALANVVLPDGARKAQQQSLSDLLAGARYEFQAMGARLVGGHTIVGPRMEVGFTVIGQSYAQRLLRKSNLKAGDQLYLTKPLGIGVLLAAHMRSRCRAAAYDRLMETMLWRQHAFARAAVEAGVEAGTDVTGFGLAGHLLEMLDSSRVAATIYLDAIPVLAGAIEAVVGGIESSLIEDNLQIDQRLDCLANVRRLPQYRLLFDPQTCGGFVFGCSDETSIRFLASCSQAGLPAPRLIGHVYDVEQGGLEQMQGQATPQRRHTSDLLTAPQLLRVELQASHQRS